MTEAAKKRPPRPKVVEAVPEPEPAEPSRQAHAASAPEDHPVGGCPVAWCPVCIAVTAVQPLRPEVVEHLLKAGTELLLAFKGVVDARAEEMTGDAKEPAGATRLEKIDLG